MWHESSVSYDERLVRLLDVTSSQEIDIQWFSILNSLVVVVLLTGALVFLLLRILHKDYQQYANLDLDDGLFLMCWRESCPSLCIVTRFDCRCV